MGKNKCQYPFTAIVGQKLMRNALIYNLINSSIGGVLIKGEKGTAKSIAVRALADLLPNTRVVELPLNATEDRVVGTIDLEHTLKTGEKKFEPGILAAADGNVLYIDEVNLLEDHIVDLLLDVAAMGVNIVEREGISHSHLSRFILVGTMNPEEGDLRPQLTDRFGLSVNIQGENNLANRVEIIKRRLAFDKNPYDFCKHYAVSQKKLKNSILKARKIIHEIIIEEELLYETAEITSSLNIDGHRADIAIVKTAATISAFSERKKVIINDLYEAAKLVLPHRLKRKPFEESSGNIDELKDKNQIESIKKKRLNGKNSGNKKSNRSTLSIDNLSDNLSINDFLSDSNEDEKIFAIGKKIEPPAFSIPDKKNKHAHGNNKRGKYISYTFPKGKINDLALDATLRASAVHQNTREKGLLALSIKNTDLREKVRSQKVDKLILFIVDASGSMGVEKRMNTVKGAILGLLERAYQKRHTVGLSIFRKDTSMLILPPTKSIDMAAKLLADIPTGGKTPITHALYDTAEYIRNLKTRNKIFSPVAIFFTDGKVNVSYNGKDPTKEMFIAAKRISKENIPFIVFDTETGWLKLGIAEKLSRLLNADYIRIDDLTDKKINKTLQLILE